MFTFTLSRSEWEFGKSCVICAMCASMVYVTNECQLLIFTCQRVNKRANVAKVYQLSNLTCQRTTSQFFEHSSYKLLRKIYILYYHIKCSTLCLRPVIHTICICIVYKNCIILHFYSLSHIKENWVEFLFFKTF